MGDRHLHIVCHDVPYPPDYGGVFDLFYKIGALKQAGVGVMLHCFEYGRGEQAELLDYCEEVNYYPRCTGHKAFAQDMPYIVCSRSSPELRERLLRDDYPILLEGVHSTYLLSDERFRDRNILLRMHNVESLYYRELARCARSIVKKIYYLRESAMLRRYEKTVAARWPMLTVNEADADYCRRQFDAGDVETMPVFLPFESVQSKDGCGCYCLYHGNLSVDENEKAAVWLLENVFNDLAQPLVIAGKKPSPRLLRIAARFPNACVVPDPSVTEMRDMIAKAHVHVLPSFNCTGIKLKLLNALFNGRHCLVNGEAVAGTGLESLCLVACCPEEFKSAVTSLSEKPFTLTQIRERQDILLGRYDNRRTAERLIARIW